MVLVVGPVRQVSNMLSVSSPARRTAESIESLHLHVCHEFVVGVKVLRLRKNKSQPSRSIISRTFEINLRQDC